MASIYVHRHNDNYYVVERLSEYTLEVRKGPFTCKKTASMEAALTEPSRYSRSKPGPVFLTDDQGNLI